MVSKLTELMEMAARKGGAVVAKYFTQGVEVGFKTSIHDVVTIADKESQKVILDILMTKGPEYGVESIGYIGEEEGASKEGEYMFIIDPLDGTGNFSAGIPYFCVSIGVMKGTDIVAGVLYDLLTDTMYSAEKGKGAYKNGKKIEMQGGVELQKSTVLSTFPSNPQARAVGLQQLSVTLHSVRTVRVFGAICSDAITILSTKGNFILNFGANIWDLAAMTLIIREAGGEVLEFDGTPLALDPKTLVKHKVVAGEKKLIESFIATNQKLLEA